MTNCKILDDKYTQRLAGKLEFEVANVCFEYWQNKTCSFPGCGLYSVLMISTGPPAQDHFLIRSLTTCM